MHSQTVAPSLDTLTLLLRLWGSITGHGMVHGLRSKSPTDLALLLAGGETANPSAQGLSRP